MRASKFLELPPNRNHILTNAERRFAVIVNDFAPLGIDAKLVRRREEQLIELSNGCICCTLRGDLLEELKQLSETPNIDYILIESTGLGEPLPIAQTFYMDDLQQRIRLDNIVSVIDAANFWKYYESEASDPLRSEERIPLAPLLIDQIEFANTVVLNKTDLLLDRELLYTVIGGLKPMSSGFITITYGAEPLDQETYQQLSDLRTILRTFRCGDELYADMMVFRRTDDGKKTAHAVVIHTRALRETIRRYAEFFAKLGVTENSHPMEVVMAVEHATPSDRHRGYGYLFGYPKYAVDFFVEAAEQQQRTGEFVERDFFHIPTFERETNLFVYAVPKGHTPNAEDPPTTPKPLSSPCSCSAHANTPPTDACALPSPPNSCPTNRCLL